MLNGAARRGAGAAIAGAYWLAGAFAAAAHLVAFAACATSSDRRRRRFLGERLGRWPVAGPARGPWLWVHGASAGEARIALAIARGLGDAVEAGGGRRPTLVVSALTESGLEVLGREADVESHAFPVDWGPIVRELVEVSPPLAFVAVETEIWPASLDLLARAGVPVSFVNARISDRSFPGYRRIAPFLAPRLARVSAVCARDPLSASRWVELGARPEVVHVAGDIKFDLEVPGSPVENIELPELEEGRPMVLAASTHDGEEAAALGAFREVRSRRPEAVLLVAPRHPDRAAAVSVEAREAGLSVRLYSSPAVGGRADVVVLDRIGLLRSAYRVARAAFVGGSLVDGPGGHNLLEAVAASCPLATGPRLANVEEQASRLRQVQGMREVSGVEDISRFWIEALESPLLLRQGADRAARALEAGRGALARSVELLAGTLGRGGGPS